MPQKQSSDIAALGLLVGLVVAAAACGKNEDGGLASVNEVSTVLQEALKLGKSTWPSAKVAGVRVADMVPRGGRANAYSVFVTYQADPTDPTATSGSVQCSPQCRVSQSKVKTVGAPDVAFPCSFDDALASARKAGMSAERPIITYGNWNQDRGAGWRFQASATGPVIKIDDDCGVMP